jgi:hypothetical protein
VTAKSSILPFGTCFINSASTRGQFCVLPWEICFVPWDLACERNWLSAERLALTTEQKSAEGIVGCELGRRPERFPARGLKERSTRLPRKDGIASVGRRPLWDEPVVGAVRDEAPVEASRLLLLSSDLICRTAVYVIRSYGGVGGEEP